MNRTVCFTSVALLGAFIIGFACFTPKARAQEGQHGVGHAENHDWYRDLKQPGTGYSCCNGRSNSSEGDCRPTRAYRAGEGEKCGEYDIPAGRWCALVNGGWREVPPRLVLKDLATGKERLAPDGNSHICASKSGMIYCFLGGSPKS